MYHNINKIAPITLAVMALAFAENATAGVTYGYTGNNFTGITDDYQLPVPGQYTTSMHVTGMFQLSTALAANISNYTFTPLRYSFSDGRNTYSELDSIIAGIGQFTVSTDGSGDITNWDIRVARGGAGNINSINYAAVAIYDYAAVEPNPGSPTTQRDDAIVYTPGQWNAAAIPEPSSYLLVVLALGLMGLQYRNAKASGSLEIIPT